MWSACFVVVQKPFRLAALLAFWCDGFGGLLWLLVVSWRLLLIVGLTRPNYLNLSQTSRKLQNSTGAQTNAKPTPNQPEIHPRPTMKPSQTHLKLIQDPPRTSCKPTLNQSNLKQSLNPRESSLNAHPILNQSSAHPRPCPAVNPPYFHPTPSKATQHKPEACPKPSPN